MVLERRSPEPDMIGTCASTATASLMHPRFLYLIGQLGVGGYERQLYYLLQTLDRQRYRPAVVVWGSAGVNAYADKISGLGIPLYTFAEYLEAPAKLMALRRLVKKLAPDLVHSYSFYTNFPAWWCTLRTATTPVGSIRNNFVSEIREAGNVLGHLSARWPSVQICNSLAAKRAVERTGGPFKPSRLHVVPNGLDVKTFKASTSLPSKPVLLAVGRLSPQKRWDRLLEAIGLVRERGLQFSARLAGDGPLRPTLEAQARRLAVDHLIEFLGIQHDVPGLLADSTFLVHTAEEEGCPNVVMEAMACGRAVVATDAGHAPCLVGDGKTGFIVERGDNRNLAERITTLIENRDLAFHMGQAGRAKAEQEFGLPQLVDQTLQAYCDAGWKG